MDAVLDAFRSGDGVPYADYGTDLHEGQARFTRPMFDALLTTQWFGAIPDVHERLLADPQARVADDGFSIFHCLPVGMVGEDAATTGTVMRSPTVRAYAEQAGFGSFEVLAIDNDFYRFYRLTP